MINASPFSPSSNPFKPSDRGSSSFSPIPKMKDEDRPSWAKPASSGDGHGFSGGSGGTKAPGNGHSAGFGGDFNDNHLSSKPSRKPMSWKTIGGVIALLVVVVGSVAGFYLAQTTQDTRQQAATQGGGGGTGGTTCASQSGSCSTGTSCPSGKISLGQMNCTAGQLCCKAPLATPPPTCTNTAGQTCNQGTSCGAIGMSAGSGTCANSQVCCRASTTQYASCYDRNQSCSLVYIPKTECDKGAGAGKYYDGAACLATLTKPTVGPGVLCQAVQGCLCSTAPGGIIQSAQTCPVSVADICYSTYGAPYQKTACNSATQISGATKMAGTTTCYSCTPKGSTTCYTVSAGCSAQLIYSTTTIAPVCSSALGQYSKPADCQAAISQKRFCYSSNPVDAGRGGIPFDSNGDGTNEFYCNLEDKTSSFTSKNQSCQQLGNWLHDTLDACKSALSSTLGCYTTDDQCVSRSQANCFSISPHFTDLNQCKAAIPGIGGVGCWMPKDKCTTKTLQNCYEQRSFGGTEPDAKNRCMTELAKGQYSCYSAQDNCTTPVYGNTPCNEATTFESKTYCQTLYQSGPPTYGSLAACNDDPNTPQKEEYVCYACPGSGGGACPGGVVPGSVVYQGKLINSASMSNYVLSCGVVQCDCKGTGTGTGKPLVFNSTIFRQSCGPIGYVCGPVVNQCLISPFDMTKSPPYPSLGKYLNGECQENWAATCAVKPSPTQITYVPPTSTPTPRPTPTNTPTPKPTPTNTPTPKPTPTNTPTPKPTPTNTPTPRPTPTSTPTPRPTPTNTPTPRPSTTPTMTPSPTPTKTPSPTPTARPTPTPIGPQCLSIAMNNLTRPGTNSDDPRLGESVSFTCGQVNGVARYIFRVVEPDGTIVAVQTNNVNQPGGSTIVSNVSLAYTINKSGKHYAQCQICTGAEENTCLPYENLQ